MKDTHAVRGIGCLSETASRGKIQDTRENRGGPGRTRTCNQTDERSSLPEELNKDQHFSSRSRTFVRICSRNFCGPSVVRSRCYVGAE